MKPVLRKVSSYVYYCIGEMRITGDLTGIAGDVDDCEISTEERRKGIRVNDLVQVS